MQTVTERLAEVNTSPALLLRVCLYLSNPAVEFSGSLKLSKTPAGFYNKPTNVESKAELVWLTDSSLLHLLSSPFTLLLVFSHRKLLSFSSAPVRLSQPRRLVSDSSCASSRVCYLSKRSIGLEVQFTCRSGCQH